MEKGSRAANVYFNVCVSSRHDRLMQTYDVMRFDINIFPLIRQMPGPPPHAESCHDGKTFSPRLVIVKTFCPTWDVFVRSGPRRLELINHLELMNEGGSEIYTMEFLSVLTIVHVAWSTLLARYSYSSILCIIYTYVQEFSSFIKCSGT